LSYTTGPAGHYREHPRFDDAVPLERQLAAHHAHREVSAAYLPYDGFGGDDALALRHILTRQAQLGDVSAWNYPAFHTLDASEVYVVRLKCSGLPLSAGQDLLLFVRALGVNQTLGFDIRGAAAWQDPGAASDAWWIDLVATVPAWEGNPIPFLGNDAASIASKIQNDPTLRQTFPNLQIDQAASLWGELTGPAQSIDFWKSQPLLWDHTLPGPKCVALIGGCGGPTNTFASPPASSIVKGKADDGALATPFPVTGTVPITTPDATTKGYALGDIHVIGAIAAVAGVLGLGYYYYYGRKGHGR
jgi:hypothetical protein